MSQHARAVIRSIDTAIRIRDRNPRLFNELLRKDRDTRALERALERHRGRQRPVGGRVEHDEVERMDLTPAQADHAAKRWQRLKTDIDRRRREDRAAMSVLERHRYALDRAKRLSTVRASDPESSGSGGGDSALPPLQQMIDEDPRWTESIHVIEKRIDKLHDLLDEYEGLGSAAQAAAAMDSYDKDARILKEGRGHPCDVVVDLLGREIAGSPRTVWRVRKQTHDPASEQWKILGFAVSTIDGTPLEDRSSQTAPGRVRRVVIEDDR